MESTIERLKNVIIENGKFIVREFETSDKDIVNYFQQIDPEVRREKFENALKIGVSAIKTVGLTDRIDYVEKEFENLNQDFSSTLDATLQELDKKSEEMFGEKGKFREILTQHFGKDGMIVKELFDPNKEGTPLYNLRNDIRNEILALRQAIGIKETEKEFVGKTPLKGKNFEDRCELIIGEVARHFGDLLENTTKVQGKLQGSKKGDFVIKHAENNKKIVFEIKDTAISTNQIQKTLEESIENRDASYGILIVKSVESLPKSIGWFQECGDNMLACALSSQQNESDVLHPEILLIAYKWARLRLMLQSFKEKKVDPAFIQEKIMKIQRKISELRLIKTQCTNIETASDKVRTIVKNLEDTIGKELSEILGSIASK